MPIDKAALEKELAEIDKKIEEYKLEQVKLNEIIAKLVMEKESIKEQIAKANQEQSNNLSDSALKVNPGDFKILEVSNEIIRTIDTARYIVEQIDQKIQYGVKAIDTITKALDSIRGNGQTIGEVFTRNLNPVLKAAFYPEKPIKNLQSVDGLLRETHQY